uniref:Uncharacterized protein n=1 Tax=Timema genevievae TaxID=629358 RepID=A0A7R9JXM9_TIMGE|nr:unnamed protein product [Timema genevievae]
MIDQDRTKEVINCRYKDKPGYPYPSYVAYAQPASPYYISGTPVYTYAPTVPVYSNAYTPASNPTYNRLTCNIEPVLCIPSPTFQHPLLSLSIEHDQREWRLKDYPGRAKQFYHFLGMDLAIHSDGKPFKIVKQIHHTTPAGNGETHRVRFVHVAFNETGEQLAAADHRGNIFIIDLNSNKFIRDNAH